MSLNKVKHAKSMNVSSRVFSLMLVAEGTVNGRKLHMYRNHSNWSEKVWMDMGCFLNGVTNDLDIIKNLH